MATRKISRRASSEQPAAATAAKADDMIGMDEAIALLKTTRPTFYRWLRSGRIKAMKLGRQWRFYRGDVERFLKGQEPRVDLPVSIAPLIDELASRLAQARSGGPVQAAPGGEPAGPGAGTSDDIGRAVNLAILLGVALKASDFTLESFSTEPGSDIAAMLRYRIDGVLQPIATFDLRLLPALVARLKTLAGCDVSEKRRPQDGRILVKVESRQVDLRASFVGAAMSESVTVRILDARTVLLGLDRIDYAEADMKRLRTAIAAPWGLNLLVGPTGSGKTTVLYSCLKELAGPGIKTMSVEDPVEYLLPWVTQIPIAEGQGLTFTRAVRSILRSDPDVIMVGEIRDRETLLLALESALTGHLVFSTLHTDEAAAALRRMVDIGADPFVVADATRVILAQRLVRKLCPECRHKAAPSADLARRAEQAARSGGLGWETLPADWREPVGCPKCGQTGYRGRTVIAETIQVTPEVGAALRRGAGVEELRATAVRQGMTTVAADGVRRASAGQTSLAEVFRVLGVPTE
ncbi:MAG TPA: ATPase, T2SS/T4P/T4SS family [Planctomycetota bacterium]|nr:ATPase, T2SS/T4P/T4SS family [Planctomycetota bacterium]